jgi:hypothetical protein
VDTDPLDDPTVITDTDAFIRQAVSQAGAQQWNFSSTKTTSLAQRADKQLYYTGADKKNSRFSQQGTAYFCQLTNAMDFNGKVITGELDCGSLFLDWEIEFQIPQINPSAVVTRGTGAIVHSEVSLLIPTSSEVGLDVVEGETVVVSLADVTMDTNASAGDGSVYVKKGSDTKQIVLSVSSTPGYVHNSSRSVILTAGNWTFTRDSFAVMETVTVRLTKLHVV